MIEKENHTFLGRTVNFLRVILFYARLAKNEDFVDYIKKWSLKRRFDKAVILGNGPSLNESLKRFDAEYIASHDFFAVNNFCLYESFRVLKPRYYTISDPMYFLPNNNRYEENKKVWKRLCDDVDWEMNIFVPFPYYKKNLVYDVSQNSNIKIVPFHYIAFRGYEASRFKMYQKGLGNGEFLTVVLNALYVLIYLGYKESDFYGIDHNFFDGLYVDKDNVLYWHQTHFYGKAEKQLKYCSLDGKLCAYTMDLFLKERAIIFHGHRIMNSYAEHCGCKVYNCTPNSLVDAYERKER